MKRIQKILALLSLVFLICPNVHADAEDSVNLRFNPVFLLIGMVDISADFAIAPNWTIGPNLNFWHYNLGSNSSFTTDYTIDSFGAGVRANWFNNGVYTNGLYVGPSAGIKSVKVKTSDSTGEYTGSLTTPYIETVVGYAWFWNSFNMMLGGGLQVPLSDSKIKVRSPSGEENVKYSRTGSLALEYTLGWTF